MKSKRYSSTKRMYEVHATAIVGDLRRIAAQRVSRGPCARSDPDAQPLTKGQLKRMKRIPFAKQVRWTIGLSQEEFAGRFQIPIGTLRNWEQGRAEPDQAARAYLTVISRNPGFVREALEAAA